MFTTMNNILNKTYVRFLIIFCIILLSNLNLYDLGYPLSRMITSTISQAFIACFVYVCMKYVNKVDRFTMTILILYGIVLWSYFSRFIEIFLVSVFNI